MIKTCKTGMTAGKRSVIFPSPKACCKLRKQGNFPCAKTRIPEARPTIQGPFCCRESRPELALKARAPIGHAPWGRRRLRRAGGGEARACPCPLRPLRLVRGYYANCSDCGNKQGGRERKEGLPKGSQLLQSLLQAHQANPERI